MSSRWWHHSHEIGYFFFSSCQVRNPKRSWTTAPQFTCIKGLGLAVLFTHPREWLDEEADEQFDNNLTVEAKALATEQALATAEAEATASPIVYPTDVDTPSPTISSEDPPSIVCATDAECNNAGVHDYAVVTEEFEGCGAGNATSVRYTVEFVEGGVNMQVNDHAPAFHRKLDNDRYHFTVSNGDMNELIFNLPGFIIVQTKADGSPCLTYSYTRSE